MSLESLPKYSLISLPTPIDEAPNFRKKIGGPRLFIKRDDLTGFAFGGNKSRKLEYLIGAALAQGADTVITSGALQTNHGRLSAAACIKAGLDFYLVVTDEQVKTVEGNRILMNLMGVKLVFAGPAIPRPGQTMDSARLEAGDNKIEALKKELIALGKKVFIIPRGGRSMEGTASYCMAVGEMKKQLASLELKIDHIIVPCATGSTLTGVLLGTKLFGLQAAVWGMALSRSAAEGKKMVTEEFNRDAQKLSFPFQISEDEINIDDGYIGAAYGSITRGGYEAMELMAQTEAIFLDPVYTGKAMAGYIDYVRQGKFSDDENVLFIHTGGYPLVFLNDVGQPCFY